MEGARSLSSGGAWPGAVMAMAGWQISAWRTAIRECVGFVKWNCLHRLKC